MVKRKYLPSQDFDPRTVQSVSSRYTDSAITVSKYEMTLTFFFVIFILQSVDTYLKEFCVTLPVLRTRIEVILILVRSLSLSDTCRIVGMKYRGRSVLFVTYSVMYNLREMLKK